MWDILEHKQLAKIINKAPREVRVRYEAWKRIVELMGPQGIKQVRGFRDEALKGDWKSYRSSRLNKQCRVIYKVDGKHFKIYVVEITPHNY